MRLYTIGNFTIDDIVIWPTGENWMGQPGGNVLFSALGARTWLDNVGIVARVGADYPAARLKEIESRGISLALHQVEMPTLHDWALYEANGARQFINHINSGTNVGQTIQADEIPPEHLEGQAYHIAPVPTQRQLELVMRLKRSGRLISLDPHESWIIGYESMIQELLAGVNFFLPSEVEACRLFGRHAPEEAAREFSRWGPAAVVIKLGADGSLLYDATRKQLVHIPCYPARTSDPTGAGDAYCGGFIAGYLLTGDAMTAAIYGTVSASYVVEAIGALATVQPTPAEAADRLAVVADKVGTAVAPNLSFQEHTSGL